MDNSIWILFGALAAANFLLRALFVLIFGRMDIPPFVRAFLPFIPAAALSALVTTQVLLAPAVPGMVVNPRLIAWLGAMFVAWKTRNVFATIVSGMVLLHLLLLVLPVTQG